VMRVQGLQGARVHREWNNRPVTAEYTAARICTGWTNAAGRVTDKCLRGSTSLNETVYLFALSVPDLLEQIIAGQAGPRITAAVPPRTEKRA